MCLLFLLATTGVFSLRRPYAELPGDVEPKPATLEHAAGGVLNAKGDEARTSQAMVTELLARRLPDELVRHIYGFFPRPVQVAFSSGRSTVIIWGADSEDPQHVLRGPDTRIVDAKFFPTGDRLATACEDGSLMIWSALTGKQLHSLRGHAPGVRLFQVQIFPDDDRVVSVGDDRTAILWSASSGEILQRFLQHGLAAGSHEVVRVYPEGDRIVTGVSSFSQDSGAIIWNVSTGEPLHFVDHIDDESNARFVELSLDGRRLVTTDARDVYVWAGSDGQMEAELAGAHDGWINGVAIAEKGETVLASCSDFHVQVWDLRKSNRRMLMLKGLRGIVPIPVGGGERVAFYTGYHIVIWNLASLEMEHELTGVNDIYQVAVSAEGDALAACTSTSEPWERQQTHLWSLSSGKPLKVLRDVYSELWPSWTQCVLALAGARSPAAA